MVRLYVSDGTNTYLVGELTVDAITASGTVATWEEDWTPPGGALMLPNGYSLRASIVNAESTIVHALGGDQPIRHPAHRGGLALEHDDLQAMIVVEMDVQGGKHVVIMIVLHVSELLG